MNRAGRVLALLGALLLALAVAEIGRHWEPDRPVAELAGRWAQPPSTFLAMAGMEVHLRDEGPRDDPRPLVLLHGTSSSLHTWDGWAAALRPHKRVVRLDLPGFGLTGPAPDGRYTIEAYVGFLVAVLDRLEIPRADVGGNSFGGYVAWATALAHPDRVGRLVLVDSAGYPTRADSMPLGFRLAGIRGLGWLVERVTPRRVVESSVRNVYGDPGRVTPDLVDRYFELTLRSGNRRALIERFRQASPGLLAHRVPEITQPTLILWGGRDRLIPPDAGRRFSRDIWGSQLVLFDDLGHVPQEEDPPRTVAAAWTFLGLR